MPKTRGFCRWICDAAEHHFGAMAMLLMPWHEFDFCDNWRNWWLDACETVIQPARNWLFCE